MEFAVWIFECLVAMSSLFESEILRLTFA